MPRYFAAEFFLRENIPFPEKDIPDHNMVGTVEDIFAACQGRVLVITGEVDYQTYRDYLDTQ